ncbi:cell wall biosynthesis protein [Methanobrevibacter sp. DSM 116169]|uniref:cell wall biosynthesis protein n=1 Tax=Methanobrevibacter sp. DSM 116169 TaxID=3242727 RepID=UPI0038FC24C8
MVSMSLVWALLTVFLLSFVFTMGLNIVFRFLGKRGFLGNLFPNVRGGIPRAIGLVPFILLSFWLPTGYNNLVLIIGIFAFIDDLLGRRKFFDMPIEWGQLSRGIGILLVIICGFNMGLGFSSILIAFLVQPINISDMQPGSTCIVTMIMSVLTIMIMLILGVGDILEIPAFYTPLLVLVVCLAYCPLDFAGKIMLGEVGNHSFAVALGIGFYMIGGFIPTLLLTIVTVCLTAFVRRNTLKVFFMKRLDISNPTFGDYFMDVLTGGGLGDLFRRIFLGKKQYVIKNDFLIVLGFRRLFYNPYAQYNTSFSSNERNYKPKLN